MLPTSTVPVAPPSVAIDVTNTDAVSVAVSGRRETEYILQASSSNATGAIWQNAATNTTDAKGIWRHVENVGGNTQRFFRAVLP